MLIDRDTKSVVVGDIWPEALPWLMEKHNSSLLAHLKPHSAKVVCVALGVLPDRGCWLVGLAGPMETIAMDNQTRKQTRGTLDQTSLAPNV